MKILIVDDIKGWRDYHYQILKNIIPNAKFDFAESAKMGYDKLLENNDTPFDLIITDMQMESDFEPKYAGEWLIEQIKSFKNYSSTNIIIISAAYSIANIANFYNVNYLRKSTAQNFPDAYNTLVEK